jgi:CheY-like chemotaxis protein
MTHGRILLADDEPVFLDSTADLLRREGHECVTANDGAAALAALEAGPSFDLLITDLEMPGNADLDLVRKVAAMSGGLPIIILTGFPSVRSAVASIELPVAAYLTKPVQFDHLKQRVATAVSRYRSYQAMQSAEQRLGSWRQDLQTVPNGLVPGASGIDMFLSLTLRNVMGSLSDLTHLGRALAGEPAPGQHACQLLNCPRGAQLQAAVKETIRVLEETKSSFKSRQLADLRGQLELLLDHV